MLNWKILLIGPKLGGIGGIAPTSQDILRKNLKNALSNRTTSFDVKYIGVYHT